MKTVDPEAQKCALGKREEGDVDNIVHLDERFVNSHENMFDRAAELRGATPDVWSDRAQARRA